MTLNRPPGVDPILVDLLSSAFHVDCDDPATGAEVARLLSAFRTGDDDQAARPVTLRTAGEVRLVTTDGSRELADPATGLAHLLAYLNTTALSAADCFAVHAGVVATEAATIAFPAVSGAGKSTLVAAALRHGFDYVSDEALCLGWELGSVRGYPRPIGLSAWSRTTLGLAPEPGDERFYSAADLGARISETPPPLTHLILLDPPSAEPRLAPVRAGEVASAMLARSFTAWTRPQAAFGLAHRVVAGTHNWRLSAGPPAATVDLLVRELGLSLRSGTTQP